MKTKILHYESHRQPLLSWEKFARRLAVHILAAFLFLGVSLFGGMAGYHYLEGLPWLDAFANASMILSGMGPLNPVTSSAGKLFAGGYALYSGLAVIVVVGLILTPIIHRLLHRFHLQSDSGN